MKCFRCLCCLCLCCVLSLSVFSLNVNAASIPISSDVQVSHRAKLKNKVGTLLKPYSLTFYTDNGVQNKQEYSKDYTLTSGTDYIIETEYEFFANDKPLFKEGGETTFTAYDCYYSYGQHSAYDNSFAYLRSINSVRANILYTNGQVESVENVSFSQNGVNLEMNFTFVPKHDVSSVTFVTSIIFGTGSYAKYLSVYLGEFGGTDVGFDISADQVSAETTELKGIKGWVQNIFNSIAELPTKLWNIISDGLKNLFIPSADFIAQFKEDLDLMLEEKLGAVYQVVDITINSWDKIKDSDETNTINFPKTSINLLGGEEFSFGGYDVKIVPSGFEFLVESIKLVCGIVCTLLFVNGLRKRYDEVMGVEQ